MRVEVPTQILKTHSEFSEVCDPDSEFSFHPWLASEIRKRIGGSVAFLKASEWACEDNACPVNETWIEVFTEDRGKLLKTIRISRKKHLISKLDLKLSFEKQGL